MSRRIVIWGAGGHASVVADAARLEGRVELVGWLDDLDPTPRLLDGLPVLGGRSALAQLRVEGVAAVAFGFGDNRARARLAPLVAAAGLELETIRHPAAVLAASAIVGPGSFLAAGAIVNPGARLGPAAIVNTAASVDHDCELGEAVHVCPGARLAGGVRVGDQAWIGIGAVVSDHRSVGARAVVGAGAVVVRDVPPDTIAYGNPARPMRQVPPHD